MKPSPSQIGVGGLVLGARERELVLKVLDSNRLSYGPMSREFEEKFSDLHDCRYGLFCNSGTSALHLALAALASTSLASLALLPAAQAQERDLHA